MHNRVYELTERQSAIIEAKAIEMCKKFYHVTIHPEDAKSGSVWISNFAPYDPDWDENEGWFLVHIDLPLEKFEDVMVCNSIVISVPDRVLKSSPIWRSICNIVDPNSFRMLLDHVWLRDLIWELEDKHWI